MRKQVFDMSREKIFEKEHIFISMTGFLSNVVLEKARRGF
jgi:hypothetical protein